MLGRVILMLNRSRFGSAVPTQATAKILASLVMR